MFIFDNFLARSRQGSIRDQQIVEIECSVNMVNHPSSNGHAGVVGRRCSKPRKCAQKFLNDLRTHGADRSQRPAANDRGGCGFKHF